MDGLVSSEQQMFADSVKRFAASVYGESPAPHGKALDRARLARIAELGCLSFAVPQEFGGFGGPIETMVTAFALGPALPPEPVFESGVHTAALIAAAASAQIAGRVLPDIAAGAAIASVATLEPLSRYDEARIETVARRTGSSVVLAGQKSNVLFGAEADWLVVSALDEGAPSLFLVRGDAPGVAKHSRPQLDGRPAADIDLADVAVEARLDGMPALDALERASTLATAAAIAEMAGIMEALVGATIEYARTRKQFGVAIGSFQALQHRMADMWIACEETRSVAAMAAYACSENGEDRSRTVASAWLTARDAAGRVGNEAIQIHGGIGMTDELVVSHWYRRLWALRQRFGDRHSNLARLAAWDVSDG